MNDTDLYGGPLPGTPAAPTPGTVPAPTPRPLAAGMDDDDRLAFFFAAVDAVRAERVSNAYVEVSRLIDGTKKYAGRGDVASFDLEGLASKWGAGRYSLQLRVGRTYRTGINVEVEGPTAGGVQSSLQSPGGAGVAGGAPAGEAGFLLQFMSTQLAQAQATTLELIKASTAKPADSFKDALLSQLLEASLAAKSGVGQIAQAMELVDRIKGSGGGGGDDGTEGLGKLAGIVERVLSTRRPAAPVGGAAAPRPAIQPAAVQATNVAPAQAAATPAPSAPAPAPFVLPVLEEFERTTGVPIVRYCRALVASIELGTDTETAGILLYRLTIASPALPAIRATLGEIEADKAAAQLVEGCPALAGQLQYVTQAVESLLQLVDGDDTPSTGGEA